MAFIAFWEHITNLQASWVHSKSVQNLLFYKFVLFNMNVMHYLNIENDFCM